MQERLSSSGKFKKRFKRGNLGGIFSKRTMDEKEEKRRRDGEGQNTHTRIERIN